jgi:hypothetical protein
MFFYICQEADIKAKLGLADGADIQKGWKHEMTQRIDFLNKVGQKCIILNGPRAYVPQELKAVYTELFPDGPGAYAAPAKAAPPKAAIAKAATAKAAPPRAAIAKDGPKTFYASRRALWAAPAKAAIAKAAPPKAAIAKAAPPKAAPPKAAIAEAAPATFEEALGRQFEAEGLTKKEVPKAKARGKARSLAEEITRLRSSAAVEKAEAEKEVYTEGGGGKEAKKNL